MHSLIRVRQEKTNSGHVIRQNSGSNNAEEFLKIDKFNLFQVISEKEAAGHD